MVNVLVVPSSTLSLREEAQGLWEELNRTSADLCWMQLVPFPPAGEADAKALHCVADTALLRPMSGQGERSRTGSSC